MSENITRQPKGVPVGGQFAATSHTDPDVTLAEAAEHRAALAETGAAARAGLPHSAATHIAGLLKNSPAAVYDENVATLAAANGTTAEAIRGIDRVFSHGDRPLKITGTGDSVPDELAAAGLTGEISPYTGNNPDIADGAWAYKSPTDRELVLSRIEDGGFMVWHEDRYDEGSFHLETAPEDVTPESNLNAVKSALWDLAVTDANFNSPTPLSTGDFYELRDVRLEKNSRGEAYAEVLTSNDDGMWTTVSHNFATGATTVDRDGDLLTGPAAEIEMAAVFEGLGSEPDNGDFDAHAKTVFGNLLAEAGRDADAPRWASQASPTEATSMKHANRRESPSAHWEEDSDGARDGLLRGPLLLFAGPLPKK